MIEKGLDTNNPSARKAHSICLSTRFDAWLNALCSVGWVIIPLRKAYEGWGNIERTVSLGQIEIWTTMDYFLCTLTGMPSAGLAVAIMT